MVRDAGSHHRAEEVSGEMMGHEINDENMRGIGRDAPGLQNTALGGWRRGAPLRV